MREASSARMFVRAESTVSLFVTRDRIISPTEPDGPARSRGLLSAELKSKEDKATRRWEFESTPAEERREKKHGCTPFDNRVWGNASLSSCKKSRVSVRLYITRRRCCQADLFGWSRAGKG